MSLRVLPELPDQIKDRLTGDYGLSAYDASVIIEERDTAAYITRLPARGATASWSPTG